MVDALAFELCLNRFPVFGDSPHVLRPPVTLLRAKGASLETRSQKRDASKRLYIPTSSHSVLPARGELGGVRPKSPGLRLCSGLPVYRTLATREDRASCRAASSSTAQNRRLGL